jgi:hypothetical protein
MYSPTERHRFRRLPATVVIVALASWFGGCSGGDQLLGTIRPESTAIQPDASTIRSDASNACVSYGYGAREVGQSLSVSFTVDRSASMADPKWDTFASGFTRFLHSNDADGSSIGINFFPFTPNFDACMRCRPNDCQCLNDCGCPCDHNDPRNCQRNATCDSNSYDRPAVEIGPMPQNGAALAMSTVQQWPNGPTTIKPALRGALDHLGWYMGNMGMHQSEHLVEVLVVGGPPAPDCAPSSIADCADVAAGSNFKSHVITFDYDGPAIDPIAQRGGGKVFRIDSHRDDIARRFAGIVDEIRRDPHCEYDIPSGAVDPSKVTIEVNLSSPDAGVAGVEPSVKLQVFPVKNRDACNNGAGWYYDRADHPTRIIVCDDTCRKIHGPTESSVTIKVGCTAAPPPP